MQSFAMTVSPSQEEAAERAAAISKLNDAFRRNPTAGRVLLTQGVEALPHRQRKNLLVAVIAFGDFNAGNDPYNEHDFGAIEQDGISYFWKIDYYAPEYPMGAADPANPHVTRRVPTVMRADEY